jgi:Rieske Fe-S protein
LAQAITKAGGAVFERSRAVSATHEDGRCTVTLEGGGTAHADHVVLASHLPFVHAGAFFARAHPYRSYALAARLASDRIRGMYISADAQTRSLRSTPDGWTIIGGEGHKVGQDPDTRKRYKVLERWARDTFDVQEIGYRWSAQDYVSVDAVPLVGPLTRRRERIWVATGYGKWGMTNGTVAAMILADLIAGRTNPWAEAFDSTRFAPRASLTSMVKENLGVGKRFVTDRLHTRSPQPATALARGEGGIVELDGETVAAFRDEAGYLHAVAATCTHLGCRVTFNTAERSWDCPCHGSRFDLDGHVVQGPAVEDLAPERDA